MVRIVRIGGWTMVWTGLLILSYVAYQLFGTDLVAAREQEAARVELPEVLEERRASLDDPVPVATVPSAPDGEPADEEPADEEPDPNPVLHEEDPPPEGEIIGAVRIPAIDVDQVLYEGVGTQTLKQGPGHIPETAFPGQPGNAAISGHRTTYGRPFFDVDQLTAGDLIEVETAVGVHTYEVRDLEVVAPTDVWVIEPREGAWLTLTTCEPKFSARQRLIVFAEMVDGPNHAYVHAAALVSG